MDDSVAPPSGILPIDKPPGLTSAAVVGRIRRLLPRGVKVGHAGTLDRFATGALLVLVGRATRQAERLMSESKTYLATVRLGVTSPSDDPETPATPGDAAAPDDPTVVAAALRRFVGLVRQTPPDYSALKIGGRRASDRVRAGQPIRLEPRPVRIDAVDVVGFAPPLLTLRVDCGRGTYIRALARDLGADLGCGALLQALRRTRVGPFDEPALLPLETVSAENLASLLRPPPG